MWSVTFQAQQRRSKRYKTEKGALKAIWKWLKVNEGQAILVSPGGEPQIIDDCFNS